MCGGHQPGLCEGLLVGSVLGTVVGCLVGFFVGCLVDFLVGFLVGTLQFPGPIELGGLVLPCGQLQHLHDLVWVSQHEP